MGMIPMEISGKQRICWDGARFAKFSSARRERRSFYWQFVISAYFLYVTPHEKFTHMVLPASPVVAAVVFGGSGPDDGPFVAGPGGSRNGFEWCAIFGDSQSDG